MERQSGRMPTATFGELPPDALLTADEVGEWLKVARRQVQRVGDPLDRSRPEDSSLPGQDILAWLETRRRDGGRRRGRPS
jgi:hypothetical protein